MRSVVRRVQCQGRQCQSIQQSISHSANRSVKRSFLRSFSSDASKPCPTAAATATAEAAHVQQRLIEAQQWQNFGVEPYVNSFKPTMSVKQYIETYNDKLAAGERLTDQIVQLTGRVTSKRVASSKLTFMDLTNDDISIQIIASRNNFQVLESTNNQSSTPSTTSESKHSILKLVRRGDLVGVRGCVGKSKTGELSLIAHEVVPLAPCLHDLPHELKDLYTRFTQRHLDFIVNGSSIRRNWLVRQTILSSIRSFLGDRSFIEVETPILWPQAGGAIARPFATHSHALGQALYLRIAPELFLKQLVIGGMSNVFEISKVFRNEGVDATHNPEFTTVELYQANADYEDMATLTQDLLQLIARRINKQLRNVDSAVVEIKVNRESKHEAKEDVDVSEMVSIDFSQPFRRVDIMTELASKMNLANLPDPNDDSNLDAYLALAKQHNITFSPVGMSISRILDKMIGHFIEVECEQPTFLMNHPICMSPLARSHPTRPGLTQRFELFIAKHEYVNAYSELNDSQEQRRRFQLQAKEKDGGNDEAHEVDEEYLKAMEFGLPPTGGWGLGVDRLCMLFAQTSHIRDVLLFPIKRSVQSNQHDSPQPKQSKE